MKKNFEMVFEANSIELSNITYNIEQNIPEDYNGDINIECKDDYKIKEISEDGFLVEVSRHVFLNPKYIFDLVVSYLIVFTIGDETKVAYKGKYDELKSEIENQIVNLIDSTTVLSRASALISSITTHVRLNPIITPPKMDL